MQIVMIIKQQLNQFLNIINIILKKEIVYKKKEKKQN